MLLTALPGIGIVSIHASAREATWATVGNEATVGFQSTPPRGRRLCFHLTQI